MTNLFLLLAQSAKISLMPKLQNNYGAVKLFFFKYWTFLYCSSYSYIPIDLFFISGNSSLLLSYSSLGSNEPIYKTDTKI